MVPTAIQYSVYPFATLFLPVAAMIESQLLTEATNFGAEVVETQ